MRTLVKAAGCGAYVDMGRSRQPDIRKGSLSLFQKHRKPSEAGECERNLVWQERRFERRFGGRSSFSDEFGLVSYLMQ
jgi:hypothetical protein